MPFASKRTNGGIWGQSGKCLPCSAHDTQTYTDRLNTKAPAQQPGKYESFHSHSRCTCYQAGLSTVSHCYQQQRQPSVATASMPSLYPYVSADGEGPGIAGRRGLVGRVKEGDCPGPLQHPGLAWIPGPCWSQYFPSLHLRLASTFPSPTLHPPGSGPHWVWCFCGLQVPDGGNWRQGSKEGRG